VLRLARLAVRVQLLRDGADLGLQGVGADAITGAQTIIFGFNGTQSTFMARHAKSTAALSLTERMRRIRKKDSKPELVVRRLIHAMGFRYRLHGNKLPGTPDIVLTRHRKVILVHGCFWHRHDCPDGTKLPSSKPEYWGPKLERNRRRDETSMEQLRSMGWDALVVWECEVRHKQELARRLAQFLK
jgi:DNA mismatch endonuclease (patch repair protein)